MARIRSVKPAFFRSIAINKLPIATRLTFIGLWTYVDDEGRGVDDARLVKAELWPLDDKYTAKRVEADLTLLAKEKRIVRYKSKGRAYIAITNWLEHQKINHPQESSFPDPDALPDDSGNDPGKDQERSIQEGKGKEGNKEGTREKDSAQSSLPAARQRRDSYEQDFEVVWDSYPRKLARKDALSAYQARRRSGVSAADLLKATRNYAASVAGKDQDYVKYGSTFYGPKDHWRDYLEPQSESCGYWIDDHGNKRLDAS